MRTLRIIFNRYGSSGKSCLVPGFSGIDLSFSSLNLILAIGMLYSAFIVLKYRPYILGLSMTFIMKRYWIFSKAFLASNDIMR